MDLDFWMVLYEYVEISAACDAAAAYSTGACSGISLQLHLQPLDSNMMEVSGEFPIVLKLALVPVRRMHE